MLFNSIHYMVFFLIVIILYFSIKQRHRWILLLLSSYYFYMSWKAEYVVLVMISTLIDYLAGIQISRAAQRVRKRLFLILSLVVNLGLLFSFKYFNFFSDSVRGMLNAFSIQLNPMTLKVLLPIGISFYTFQTLSYTIDVYRGNIRPERHLGVFAVYVAFFPQLVAGPIERAKNLLPQIRKVKRFDIDRVVLGLKMILWGYFKKVVIADNLALVVDPIYANIAGYSGAHFILGTLFFGFQIYCDFSGYTDIARGSAKVLGFDLMKNFDRPYFSRSVREFWKRWHISLSSWFRDYLYIPLGGSKVSKSRWVVNILIVFLLSGLWHGADWTFVLWGLLHGLYLILWVACSRMRWRLPSWAKVLVTFVLVNIGWIFFRAGSIGDAIYIFSNLFTYTPAVLDGYGVAVGLVFIVILVIIERFYRELTDIFASKPWWVKQVLYAVLILVILVFGVFERNEFIYFEF